MSNFDYKSLGDLADCRMGETILSKDLDGAGYPVFSADSSAGEWGRKRSISKVLRRGSIVVGARGTIGNPRLPDHDEFGCTQTTIAVSPSSEVDPYFLKLALENSDLKSIAAQQAVPMLTIGEISRLELPVPPLPEQKKIAEILSRIDILIDKKNYLLQKNVQIQKSLSLSLLHLGANRLGGDSEHITLGEILTLSRGVDITKATAKPGPFPVVSSSGVSGWHDSFTAESGVVVGRKGSIGNVHFIETRHWVHDTSLGVIDYKSNCKRFVYHLLRNMDLAQYGTKSGSPSLNRNDLHPLPVRCPPLPQQKKIASILDGGDEKVRKLELEIYTLGNLKKAISHDLLSGRKRVSV